MNLHQPVTAPARRLRFFIREALIAEFKETEEQVKLLFLYLDRIVLQGIITIAPVEILAGWQG